MEETGNASKTPERPIVSVKSDAMRALEKIAIDVKGVRNEEWKGPLDLASENLNFAREVILLNPSIREFFLRSGCEVVFTRYSKRPIVETLVGDLIIASDKLRKESLLISVVPSKEPRQAVLSVEVDSGRIQPDKLLEWWKAGYKPAIQQLAKLEKKDVVAKIQRTIFHTPPLVAL